MLYLPDILPSSMLYEDFIKSLTTPAPPEGIEDALKALWYDGHHDWHQAHEIAQHLPSEEGYRVHAYLHRKDGDLRNAHYWYRQAGVEIPEYSLEEEWEELVRAYFN
ncbi:MAG: hypothetical protein ACE5FF_13885 [Saprospiraceae bacterium]